MHDHDVYAHAFVAASEGDEINQYLEFKDMVKVFKDSPEFVDALLFNRALFNDFKEEFESSFSVTTFNFLDIVIEDGLIDQIFKIEESIRDHLVQKGLYNYCIIESPESLSESFDQKLTDLVLSRTDGNVDIVKKINPRLKSGIRMYLNDESIDLSIAGRLERLLSEVS